MTRKITGYKGGGKGGGSSSGGGSTPDEAADSLRSRQYARLIDLVCEGEIEGLATGDLRSVYLDKTPVMNEDGSYNFDGLTIKTRNGTQSQDYIPGFPSIEAETSVGVQAFENVPVVRSITNSTVDAVRVTIGIPQLVRTDLSSGDIEGANVRFRIQVQADGGSYETKVEDRVEGKTTTRYQRSYVIPLTGDAPWNVRVIRMSDDSDSQYLQNATWWDSYTEITNAKLRFPNSALVATLIDSKQFSAIPTRGYDMKLLRVQVPSNYEPGTRTYTGTWDGTFHIRWSDNPAWVFYDMVTNSRYGLGQFIDASQIDKWALYQIGRYCDEMVPDGFGGLEPRFTCNLYIQQQQEAFKVVQDLASVFRGMAYWGSGLITAIQDAPSDPVALYTNANVQDGLFTYAGSSLKTRHTVALVQWNDPADFYALKPEYVEDAAGIARYGIIQTSVVAVGCTSRGQAHRVGKWLLYSESNETETVTFKAGQDGALVRPGQVMKVQDAARAGVRRGGRITSATTTAVTVDQAFTPDPAATYTLSVMLPDGTVESATVDSVAGNTFNLATALSAAPQANAVWLIASNTLTAQLFRVVSVIDGGDGTFEISGLKQNAEKFDFVERDVVLTENPISLLNSPPNAPQNVSITEALYQAGSTVQNVVTIAWGQVELASRYALTYQVGDNNPVSVDNIRSQSFELRDAKPGVYQVSVVAISATNKRSTPSTASKQVFGKTAPPLDVENFSLAGISNGVAQLVWQQAQDLDVIIGGYVRIRHSPDIVAPDWTSAVDIGPALPGGATTASVPHIDGTYLAKFVDSSGNPSVNAVGVITRTASLINMNVVETLDEAAFAGAHDGTYAPDSFGGLSISYAGLVDDIPDVDALLEWDTNGGVSALAYYNFSTTADLGAVYTCRVTAAIAARGYDDLNTIDERGPVDIWTAVDGDVVDDVNAVLQVRTTDDDPAGSPTWSTWRPFFVGQYTARGYQFRLQLTSEQVNHNISITQLAVTIDVPDRVESERNISSGTGAYSVTFPAAFMATPSIGITANNMATGDYYLVTAQDAEGFDIAFKNSAGTGVIRTFDYLAKGYGFRA